MEDVDNDYFDVDDIVSQLKDARNPIKVQEEEEEALTKDQLEAFIIKNTGRLIKKALDVVDNTNDYFASAPDPDSASAMANLIGAATSALDTLNKVYIADERNKTQREVKQLEIASRERMNTQDNQVKVLLSREDVMRLVEENSDDVVEV